MKYHGIIQQQAIINVEVPSAPSGVSSSENGLGVITTTWTDNSEDTEEEDNFRVEARFNSGVWSSYSFIADEPTDDTSNFFDPQSFFPVGNGDKIQVRVRAENTAGNSSWAVGNEVTLANQPS